MKRSYLVVAFLILTIAITGCAKKTIDLSKLSPDNRAKRIRNIHLSVSELKKLSTDPEWVVRDAIIDNSNVTEDILEKFTDDPAEIVRRDAVRHKLAPLSMIKKLANDEKYRVRLAVAQKDATPIEILDELSKDPNEKVSAAATKALNERAEKKQQDK